MVDRYWPLRLILDKGRLPWRNEAKSGQVRLT
jgi:hypothetical protein